MNLGDAGEKALLEMAGDICDKDYCVRVGVGDDAAVFEMGDEFLVISTDMLVEGVHFIRDWGPEFLGKKGVVANLSDLAAMGAHPLGLVFSFGAPSSEDVDFVSDLLKSINSTARSYGSYVIGGDMNESEKIITSGTSFGRIDEAEILLRSGAEPGDVIGITGKLGEASAGIEALLSKEHSLSSWKSLESALFGPVARVKEGRTLAESGHVTSCIDITDGLVTDAWRISRASEVGLILEEEKIPVNEAVLEFAQGIGKDPDEFFLYGGEDFELLFTANAENWKDLKDRFEDSETKISKIGEVTSEEGVHIRIDGSLEKLPDRGYDHFKK